MENPTSKDFEQAAGQAPANLVREIWLFLCHNKKWWLMPILALFAIFGALLLLGGTGAAPFIYTLF
jgi:hypothetical protein